MRLGRSCDCLCHSIYGVLYPVDCTCDCPEIKYVKIGDKFKEVLVYRESDNSMKKMEAESKTAMHTYL